MSALPHRVLHQQPESQLQTQLTGLWSLSRRLRHIAAIVGNEGGAPVD
jgi:hypothetical protein